MAKITLRIVHYPLKHSIRTDIDTFEGDIEKDKKYWKEHHNANARYFELKEIRGGGGE